MPSEFKALAESNMCEHDSTMNSVGIPLNDWVDQTELAAALSISPQTASNWAKADKLRRYEHGVAAGGRRKYSLSLLQHEIQTRMASATSAISAEVEENMP